MKIRPFSLAKIFSQIKITPFSLKTHKNAYESTANNNNGEKRGSTEIENE